MNRDGDGFLVDMNDWTEIVAKEMMAEDGVEIDEDQWEQILKAREYYEENGTVPAIRIFAKYIGRDKKELFKQWMTGPMKPIAKYGGLPKPTGCV